MGIYLNPGNDGFRTICRGKYVDKTGLISLINGRLDGPDSLICVSRPRRFGKSYAAQMLCAYYEKSADSAALFKDKKIAEDPSFREHLNRYNVLYVDMTSVIGEAGTENLVPYLKREITKELMDAFLVSKAESFTETLINAASISGSRFIMIIDEWDAPIREAEKDFASQRAYLEFLRMLFKSSAVTSRIFAGVYMTGILPVKKDGSQSAISNFDEFTMIKPRNYAEYVGFTEAEVEDLCRETGADPKIMRKWYDGYTFPEVGAVYNPNSVMKALKYQDYDSYWTESSASDRLMDYISRDFAGLSKTVAELVGGVSVPVSTTGFANDLVTFKGKDDVLTLLIHLGYLAYDEKSRTVCIPNEEIRGEFSRVIREVNHEETYRRLRESDRLLEDTIHMNEEAVAEGIEKVHGEETSPLHYNNEQALRSTIKLAYFTYRDHYIQWEELPSGEGFADIVYLPKKDSDYPVLVVELKWNETAEGAIRQIKDRKYPASLEGFGGDIFLVGISYDKNRPAGQRKHFCKIEKYRIDPERD